MTNPLVLDASRSGHADDGVEHVVVFSIVNHSPNIVAIVFFGYRIPRKVFRCGKIQVIFTG